MRFRPMPADPAAPVTEPRAELVEAARDALLAHVPFWADQRAETVVRIVLAATLPALLDEHEQQIRAKVAGEIEAEKRRAVDRAPGWFAGMANAEHIAARGTEGGTR